jgi:hypothetical protein
LIDDDKINVKLIEAVKKETEVGVKLIEQKESNKVYMERNYYF